MKRKMIVSSISVLCSLLLMFSSTCHALLTWNSTMLCHPTFTINGSTAYWDLTVSTNDSSDSIRASVYLYRMNSNGSETMIDSWTLLDGIGRLDSYGSHPNITTGTYRLSYSIYVDGSGGEDFISGELFDTKS